jgi:hypothetical protein
MRLDHRTIIFVLSCSRSLVDRCRHREIGLIAAWKGSHEFPGSVCKIRRMKRAFYSLALQNRRSFTAQQLRTAEEVAPGLGDVVGEL